MTTNEKIRSNIRWLRIAHNLTQEQLAELITCSRPALASWEEGRATPGYDHLIAIADYFKTTVDELIRVDMSKCYVVENVKVLAKLTIEK